MTKLWSHMSAVPGEWWWVSILVELLYCQPVTSLNINPAEFVLKSTSDANSWTGTITQSETIEIGRLCLSRNITSTTTATTFHVVAPAAYKPYWIKLCALVRAHAQTGQQRRKSGSLTPLQGSDAPPLIEIVRET